MINILEIKEYQKISLCERAKKEISNTKAQIEKLTSEEYKDEGYKLEFKQKALESFLAKIKTHLKQYET